MRVVEIMRAGGPEVLEIVERLLPQPGPGEVLVQVLAASVNRPDIQQRRGLYPPPPGVTDVPGLDAAGRVVAVGEGVARPRVGDAVCALANGGAYADFLVVPAIQCMPVPAGLSFIEAASLPEAFFTAWNNIIWLGRLGEGETLLVQGGTSGVGMAGIQMAKLLRNARVFATASSAEKRAACLELGADAVFDYREDWASAIRAHAGEHCLDVALDAQAGPYVQQQLDLMAMDGRIVFIASHQGETAEVNIRDLVRRRLTLTGSTLRPRSSAYKGSIATALVEEVWPLLESGKIVTRVHAVFALDEVREAHALLDANEQLGKVVLVMDQAQAAERP
ncbi:NAD(P)H-quinone oxidoreductase [Devosia rhizoryzae]|uniref:NAD(P)H-quinone oxidoreductase n=1 Tax=Devosia rhizoryzae TaxID=2774137 RepID=A0ABX7C745_9HYPH|nr:NAD(P)H-quinone oxidoreductase [Devosia rhizoryzae]QQR38455.1 NAD(P)H-quinone oxidoreductase [Devosia rhizoryzae]